MTSSGGRPDGLDPRQSRAVDSGLPGAEQEPGGRFIPRRSPDSRAPASFAQGRLWYIDQWQPNSPLYNMHAVYRLGGPLDVALLDRCLTEIARRHEVLRTRFVAPDGAPVQVVEPPGSVASSLLDLSSNSLEENEGRLQGLLTSLVRQSFRLDRLPLWRSAVIRLAPDEHVWVLTIHHVICDGWSMQILNREVSTLYEAFGRGEASPLPDLPIQYADYSIWQRQMLGGPLLQEQLKFWMSRLSGAPPLLELPLDHPRPSELTSSGFHLRSAAPSGLAAALTTFCKARRVTPFITLLTAFAVLLRRITGQEDLVIGTPVANRSYLELEPLIGFFVNTLALRIDVSGNPTFGEMLNRVRSLALDAYDHQDLPFERLVEELHPERALTYTPVFQVLFQADETARTRLTLPGLTVKPLAVDSGTARIDLTLAIQRDADGLHTSSVFNSDLFERSTIEEQVSAFHTLLETALDEPDTSIAALPLLSPSQQQRVLIEWNRTGAAYPSCHCLHHLFEEQAARWPDSPAVWSRGRTLTYDELNRRANALAFELMERGVRPEVPVAILMDRGPAAIVALLGVMKAGGAYLPLDTSTPADRLRLILQDAGVSLALTCASASQLLEGTPVESILVDLERPLPDHGLTVNPITSVTPDNLAYIIYTSGSTGVPRGVLVAHRGVVNMVAFDHRTFDLGPSSRVIDVVSLSFDAATRHIFLALGGGGCLYMPDAETILSPPALLELMREQAITHAPFIVSVIMALPWDELPALRVVNVGGEACPAELVARWGAGRRLFNVYGPTETSIFATLAECAADGHPPPIGRPIANSTAYVLDENQQPLPVGTVGELCLGGIGVARGYLNRPELTAERFLPDPFSSLPGARLYRTGDLARFRPDGNIGFVGRRGFQVKIRGFRVELGEIEGALSAHPAVRQAVVVTFGDASREHSLAAYVVLHEHASAATDQLIDYLAGLLPPYMVPASLAILPALPLTSSGKIDRGALPAPARRETPGTYHEPRTEMERSVAAVWRRVLNLDRVGTQENFFDLGGHSLLAMQVVAQLEGQYGVRLSPRDLLLGTLAQVAASLERQSHGTGQFGAPDAPRAGAPERPHGIRGLLRRLRVRDGDPR